MAFGVDRVHTLGICKKIEMQADAIGALNENCDIILVNNNAILRKVNDWEEEIIVNDTLSYLLKETKKYDVCYFRNAGHNGIYNKLLKNLKGKTTIVEIPTYPIIGEFKGKAKGRIEKKDIIGAIKSYFGGMVLQYYYLTLQKKYVDIFVLTTKECAINGAVTVNILNGIDPQRLKKRKLNNHQSAIKLLAVANVSYWHGLDRVIKGLSLYHGEREIEFIIVGDGSEINELKRLVELYSLKDKVFFKGQQMGDSLNLYFDECDVAVGSLGLHRLGIKPSSLKCREYMARGIPFIMTDAESVEKDSTVTPFIYEIPGDESPVNIQDIVYWLDHIDMESASESLRNYAERNCSWTAQMKKVSDAVNEITGK